MKQMITTKYPKKWFNKEELANTEDRHKRFIEEWENKNNDFKFTMFDNPGYTGIIALKDITFSSMCAHHLLPFTGKIHIGYCANDKICGASKLIRTVEKFASKPQTQEKLTFEIIEFLQLNLKPKGVIVCIESSHDCMRIRGVKNPTAVMITSEVRGIFLKSEPGKYPKEEFMRLIGK